MNGHGRAQQTFALQELSCANVRCDHALLDHLVGVVAFSRNNAVDLSVGAKDDGTLRCVEFETASFHPGFDERTEEVSQSFR